MTDLSTFIAYIFAGYRYRRCKAFCKICDQVFFLPEEPLSEWAAEATKDWTQGNRIDIRIFTYMNILILRFFDKPWSRLFNSNDFRELFKKKKIQKSPFGADRAPSSRCDKPKHMGNRKLRKRSASKKKFKKTKYADQPAGVMDLKMDLVG